MSNVRYGFIGTHSSDLSETIRDINRSKDKIIAVTQYGNVYTIFYEINGNDKENTDG